MLATHMLQWLLWLEFQCAVLQCAHRTVLNSLFGFADEVNGHAEVTKMICYGRTPTGLQFESLCANAD